MDQGLGLGLVLHDRSICGDYTGSEVEIHSLPGSFSYTFRTDLIYLTFPRV